MAQQARCPRALERGLSEDALVLWKAWPAQGFWSPVIADDKPGYVLVDLWVSPSTWHKPASLGIFFNFRFALRCKVNCEQQSLVLPCSISQ